jgi:hypothetical protein
MEIIKYIPAIDSIRTIDELKTVIQPNDSVLLGEYGLLSPVPLFSRIREITCKKLYFELLSKNKNRDLIESFLLTGAAVGFNGVVIASGIFKESENMGKPVYDLDPSQILRLALSMRSDGRINKNFDVGVRAATGDGPARERTLFFLNEGADFIAVKDSNIDDDLKKRAFIIQQLEEAS